ncbi:MAG: hypothetical protein QOG95_1413 [Mycobacterium sp.]|nr:hypothetical protein [Mycobacterium sp.]
MRRRCAGGGDFFRGVLAPFGVTTDHHDGRTLASQRACCRQSHTGRSADDDITLAAYSARSPHEPRLPYASLKAAVATFTRGIARTHGKSGIRANSVAPGAVETDALHAVRGYIADSKGYPYDEALERALVEDFGFDAALGRPGQPDEIGALIAFLLSDICAFVTGQTIYADGGAP